MLCCSAAAWASWDSGEEQSPLYQDETSLKHLEVQGARWAPPALPSLPCGQGRCNWRGTQTLLHEHRITPELLQGWLTQENSWGLPEWVLGRQCLCWFCSPWLTSAPTFAIPAWLDQGCRENQWLSPSSDHLPHSPCKVGENLTHRELCGAPHSGHWHGIQLEVLLLLLLHSKWDF